eukprot:TRINITY_DN2528_c3_g1_i1.p1 TRINITY_DN2528_c3_g1~~TRINITY_DN2528_c3_g1_i1.p1  ORF type:complete len:531 (+),score=205.54 TRINITY_DN2528_c3_g1_i1:821-2413(+)
MRVDAQDCVLVDRQPCFIPPVSMRKPLVQPVDTRILSLPQAAVKGFACPDSTQGTRDTLTFSEKGAAIRRQFAESDSTTAAAPSTSPQLDQLLPWASAMLNHMHYGRGGLVAKSPTVFLSNEMVLKASTKSEAALMAQLSTTSIGGKVPQLVATWPARKVFAQGVEGDTAILYRKIPGTCLADLLEATMKGYLASPEEERFCDLTRIVEQAVEAARNLFHEGLVQQDLWLGNIIASDSEEFGWKISFLDVGDFTGAGDEAFTASLGGLLVSILGALLGLLFHGKECSFTPRYIWKDLPMPWWIHTHWDAPPPASDQAKVKVAKKVLDMLMSFDVPPVIQVALVTHMERFLGVRHAVAVGALDKIERKYRLMSVKRAVLASGMMTKDSLAHCIESVRGRGFWTLLRHEIGKKLQVEVLDAVRRRHMPSQSYFNPCPHVAVPITPPTRGSSGVLPASLVLPKHNHIFSFAELHAPSAVQTTQTDVDSDHISNLLTLEHMVLCGELPEHISQVLTKWAGVYGIPFRTDDFTEL